MSAALYRLRGIVDGNRRMECNQLRVGPNGYTIELHYDEDGEPADPRDCDGNFLFLGFPHRNYKIGDETLDPSDSFDCPACGGSGWMTTDEVDQCPRCEGDGIVYAQNLTELIELIKIKYRANMVMPVGMIDHSGVSYYLGGGAHSCDPGGWDSGTCGLILDTPETLEVRGFPTPITDEWLIEGFRGEIEDYSKWANGEVYGYRILDINGDIVEDCWGFLGFEYVEAEAMAVAEHLDPQPSMLYDVRLTKVEIEALVGRLDSGFVLLDTATSSALEKLQAIDTDEEDDE